MRPAWCGRCNRRARAKGHLRARSGSRLDLGHLDARQDGTLKGQGWSPRGNCLAMSSGVACASPPVVSSVHASVIQAGYSSVAWTANQISSARSRVRAPRPVETPRVRHRPRQRRCRRHRARQRSQYRRGDTAFPRTHREPQRPLDRHSRANGKACRSSEAEQWRFRSRRDPARPKRGRHGSISRPL